MSENIKTGPEEERMLATNALNNNNKSGSE